MIGLILLLAIAWSCAKALDSGTSNVSAKHKKRMKKAAQKKGNKTGAKTAARIATGATCAHTFLKAFIAGWKREWPKARERAAARFDKTKTAPTEPGDDITKDGTPRPANAAAVRPTPAVPAGTPKTEAVKPPAHRPPIPYNPKSAPALALVKDRDPSDTTPIPDTLTGGNPMALATIPEVTGVNTLKTAVARFASEANVTAEEAAALAQRAAEQLAAIESAIEQASALEFGDDGGTLEELYALRDMYTAALGAAQAYQKTALDSAAIASQSSKNIHNRHTNIQEAITAQGGRMASKQAYTNDV